MFRILRPVVGGVCLAAVLCGSLAAAPTTLPEVAPTESQEEAPANQTDVTRQSGGRAAPRRSVDPASLPDPATGDRNIDLLLDMQGKGAEIFNGPEPGKGAASLRIRAAASAPGRPPTEELPGDEASNTEQTAQEAALRERRWSGNLAASADATAQSTATSGYRGDLDGVDLRNTPFRKLLIFVRDHREWVITGAMALLVGMMAVGMGSRTRRRR